MVRKTLAEIGYAMSDWEGQYWRWYGKALDHALKPTEGSDEKTELAPTATG